MKKRVVSILSALCLVTGLAATPALACTSVYIGQDLTKTGSIYYGRSEDIGALYNKIFEVRPAADHEEGDMFEDEYGFSMPYPSHTLQYTMVRDPIAYGDTTVDPVTGEILIEAFAEAGINEMGVSVCATVSTGYNEILTEVDPPVDGGLFELSLATVVLQGSTSAKGGVDLLVNILDTCGAGDDYECFNSVLIGDGQEVWHFQGLSGHQYVAVKLPADKISINPNILMVGEVDVSDTENVIASEDLISLPLEHGFLVSSQYDPETYDAETDTITKINIRETYGTDDGRGQYTRYWQGINYFNPQLAETLDIEAGGMLHSADADPAGPIYYFYDPAEDKAGEITTFDALRFLAYRGEGTDYDSNQNRRIYSIGNESQAECHIFELRPSISDPQLATVEWLAMDRAEYGVYLPYYCALITETSELYQSEYTKSRGMSPMDIYNLEDSPANDSMFWVFSLLNALCDDNRANYGAKVQEFWDGYQQELIKQHSGVDAEMLALPAEERAAAATEKGKALAQETFGYAKTILDELVAFIDSGEDGVFTPSVLTSNEGGPEVPHYGQVDLTAGENQDIFTVDTQNATHTGEAITKEVSGLYQGVALVEGIDYTVSYENNVEVGEATLTITGKGSFTGTQTFHFQIVSASKPSNSGTVGTVGTSSLPTIPDSGLAVKPTVKENAAEATLSQAQAKALVNDVVKNDKDTATIQVDAAGDVEEASVTLPASAVAELGSKTQAGLTVETPLADVALSNEALESLGKDAENVTITAAKEDDLLTFTVTKDDTPVETLEGGLTAAIPAADASAGTVVILVNPDGSETILKKVVAVDGVMTAMLPGCASVKLVDNAKSFDDVDGHWAAASGAIDFVSSRELFQGVDGHFLANEAMSRAMLVTVLYRLEDMPAGGKLTFPDVDEDSWYTDAVAWAASQDIVQGTGLGFQPDDSLTREQLATLLYRYAQTFGLAEAEPDSLAAFHDSADVSPWAADAMKWAVGAGLLEGVDETTLVPTATATRAEVATILMRLCQSLAK